jgi:hypothetical protein
MHLYTPSLHQKLSKASMKNIILISKLLAFTIPLWLIGAFFGLDLPLSALLNALKGAFLPAFAIGLFLTLFQEWALKKGGITKDEAAK